MEIEGYHSRVYSIHSSTSFTHTAHTSLHTHHTSTTEKSRLHKCFAFQTIRLPSIQPFQSWIYFRVSSHFKVGYVPSTHPNPSFFLPSTWKSFLIIPRLGALYNSYPLLLHLQLGPPFGQLGSPSVKQEREAPSQISILSMHITYLNRKAIIQDYTASIRLKVHITKHTLTTHTNSTTESPVYTNASHFKPYILLSMYPAISKLGISNTPTPSFFYHWDLNKVSTLFTTGLNKAVYTLKLNLLIYFYTYYDLIVFCR